MTSRLAMALASLAALVASPAMSGLITVQDVEDGLAKDPHYGEIIREIRIEGDQHTDEDLIQNSLYSRVGEIYTEEGARRDMLWVSRLGAFTSVSFEVEPIPEGIILTVRVSEASPYIPSISFALTQENGVEIGPAASSTNLFGRAARASVYARFGGATNLGVRYADPQIPINKGLATYRIEYFHRERTNELIDFGESTDELFVELKRVVHRDLRGGFRFRYLGLKADQPNITLDENRDNIPSLGLFLEYDSRNGIYPTKGWFLDGEIARYGMFGGDGDYWRYDIDGRRYVPLGFLGKRHSLALYVYAALVSGTLGKTVPLHQEFYIGGTNSVRGWSLGSRQGQNQWLNTIEYWFELMEQKFWKIWFIKLRMGYQLGVFYDIGTAWTDDEELDRNWIGGGGFGFRLTLPILTVVRFDAAMGEDGMGVRIFIGGGEKATAQKLRVR